FSCAVVCWRGLLPDWSSCSNPDVGGPGRIEGLQLRWCDLGDTWWSPRCARSDLHHLCVQGWGCSDLCDASCVWRSSHHQRRLFNVVTSAKDLSESASVPGIPAGSSGRRPRSLLQAAGMKERFRV